MHNLSFEILTYEKQCSDTGMGVRKEASAELEAENGIQKMGNG